MLLFYLSLLDTPEEKEKFEQLYNKYSQVMKYTARDVLKNEFLAEEAVHEAFIKVIRSLYKVEEVDSPRTKRFLVVITENTAIDILRKEKPNTRISYDNMVYEPAHEPDMLDNIVVEEIAARVSALPERYRSVMELHAFHHLTDKQIATVLDISHDAVRKRMERARIMLAIDMGLRKEEETTTTAATE